MSTASAMGDYRDLVAEAQPRVIHDEGENDKYIQILEQLDRRWDRLTAAERTLHELLTLLIETFEEKQYELRKATPVEAVTELMAANGLKQKDLVGSVFETTSVVSAVLGGKRQLTVDHIRRLAERFGVSAELFV